MTTKLLPQQAVTRLVASGLIEDVCKKSRRIFQNLFEIIGNNTLFNGLVGGKNQLNIAAKRYQADVNTSIRKNIFPK